MCNKATTQRRHRSLCIAPVSRHHFRPRHFRQSRCRLPPSAAPAQPPSETIHPPLHTLGLSPSLNLSHFSHPPASPITLCAAAAAALLSPVHAVTLCTAQQARTPSTTNAPRTPIVATDPTLIVGPPAPVHTATRPCPPLVRPNQRRLCLCFLERTPRRRRTITPPSQPLAHDKLTSKPPTRTSSYSARHSTLALS